MKSISTETGSGISWGGVGIGFMGLMQEVEWVTVVGLAAAVGGFLMNFYFSYQKNRREEEEHRRHMLIENEEHEMKKQVYKSQIEHCNESGNDAE